MSTKVKGLFKGLRYISNIFEEEKEEEIQIGFPTDVKHVAHIGFDGPAVENPTWMKEFKAPTAYQSQPLDPPGAREEPEVKWVSEDSKRGHKAAASSPAKDPEVPRSSRRHHSADGNSTDSPRKKDASSKSSRHSRRSKESSSEGGSVKSSRKVQVESGAAPTDSQPPANLPDIPKKSRRKKSKDSLGGEGSSRGKSRGDRDSARSGDGSSRGKSKGDGDLGRSGDGSSRGKSKRDTRTGSYPSQCSDLGPENDSMVQMSGPQSGPIVST